jgi:DNA-binding NarL/FixJ family response regulator
MERASIRVLVVEDFAPFRQFIRSTLGNNPGVQVICEVSDGLEAVRQAEELKPDLILLDIGLPTLTGLDAARQIRKLAPESKIVFLTQESSADVVQEALNLGARGYVVKIRAATDLLAAVDAVVEGRQFVSGGLSGQHFTDTNPRPPVDY